MVLSAWTWLGWGQRPNQEDARALIENARHKALDYAKLLPDFVCVEEVHRFVDSRQRGLWVATDRLTVKLSYFQRKEDHKLLRIDNQPTDQDYEKIGGATGEGEFGATLESIFDPASQTDFRWESWKNVRKRRAAVFGYTVAREHSRYELVTGSAAQLRSAVVAFHGQLEVDAETGEVLHLTYLAGQIPKELDLEYAGTTVDYARAAVGGRDYLLPAHSETVMRGSRVNVRNVMEFRAYNKFDSESSISFGPGK